MINKMKCPFVIKKCTKCGKLLVANTMNFPKRKDSKNGLRNDCRKCHNRESLLYRKVNKILKNENNPFDNINPNKVWNHCPFVIRICTKCGEILVANDMNFYTHKTSEGGLRKYCKKCDKQYREEHKEEKKQYMKQYCDEHKEEKSKYDRQYRKEHKEEKKEYKKKYYDEHKEELKEYQKQYNEEHKEELKEYRKKYNKDNPEKLFNQRQKRRLLEESQGNGITSEQWYEMMNFFDWCCAYSGEYIGGDSDKRTIDHIIPLSKGGKHEMWNLVPMVRNYNSSKGTKDMLDWYIQQPYFSEERLQKIYEWCKYVFEKWGNRDE